MRVNQKSKKEVVKGTIHNVFLIDNSGSMSGDKYRSAISGANELLKSIEKDQFSNNTVTIVEFEGTYIKRHFFMERDCPKTFNGRGTGGSTPLYQAMGETMESLLQKKKVDDKVLINVFTDGEENSSQGKYKNVEELKSLIQDVEKSHGFTVTFVGTSKDVAFAVNNLNLSASNTLVHDNTFKGIADAFTTTVSARMMYSQSFSEGEDVSQNFYTKTIDTGVVTQDLLNKPKTRKNANSSKTN